MEGWDAAGRPRIVLAPAALRTDRGAVRCAYAVRCTMGLTLLMLRCPDAVAPERREVSGGEFSIGRGPDNDWILADPERHLSKRHCQLAFRSGQWQLADLSANGTFLNHAAAPVGGTAQPLRSGDRITFGAYEIEAVIEEDDFAASGRPQPSRANLQGSQRPNAQGSNFPASDSFHPGSLDPFAEPPPPRLPFGADPLLRAGPTEEGAGGIRLPSDFDPLDAREDPFDGPVQPDHARAINQAFRPPPMTAAAIPDDWDLDLPVTPSAAPPNTARTPSPAPPVAPSPPPLHVAAPIPAPAHAAQPAPPPAAPALPPGPDEAALLAAFLRGAGLAEATLPDPVGAMERTGAAMRATVSGIRQALIARASIKGEFRIEQTMIRTTGNNPLKFSAGDDDALAALLGVGRRNTMPPAEAVADALRDMRLHELATVTAMQAAVRALLAEFDPASIDRQAGKSGLGVVPGQRKARAWDAFTAMHARVSQALSDDFDSVFGRAFARAYEQAMRELSAPDAPRDAP